MIKVLVTICFLNPMGFWDGCTLYTSTEEITSKNECKEKIDEFDNQNNKKNIELENLKSKTQQDLSLKPSRLYPRTHSRRRRPLTHQDGNPQQLSAARRLFDHTETHDQCNICRPLL